MITSINEEYAYPQCQNLQFVYLRSRAEITD